MTQQNRKPDGRFFLRMEMSTTSGSFGARQHNENPREVACLKVAWERLGEYGGISADVRVRELVGVDTEGAIRSIEKSPSQKCAQDGRCRSTPRTK